MGVVGCERRMKGDEFVESSTKGPDVPVVEGREISLRFKLNAEILLGSVDALNADLNETMLAIAFFERFSCLVTLEPSMPAPF